MTENRPAPAPPGKRTSTKGVKLLVFSLLPVLFLILVLEVGLRALGLAVPGVRTLPLPEEYEGLFRPDEELQWALRANLDTLSQGKRVTTNDHGLRSYAITEKRPDEFRILSLGESSTFGSGVSDEETYSALLERYLAEADPAQAYRVINAGVPAYSSFQSLVYLKTRGLELHPDMVLFYHEMNDYLPSSLRNARNDEIGLSLSDKQIYNSRVGTLQRKLLSFSAIYRFIAYRVARYQVAQLQRDFTRNPLLNIGLPDIGLPPRVTTAGKDPSTPVGLNERALPSRVLPEERLENLEELAAICRERGIRVFIIHPSYKDTRRHECVLTEFCLSNGIPMLEAFDVLHPPDLKSGSMYLGSMHPDPHGHRSLARALADMIVSERLHLPSN